MRHLNAGRATGATPHADDDWWTLCGELVDRSELAEVESAVDCVDCVALLLDDDDA